MTVGEPFLSSWKAHLTSLIVQRNAIVAAKTTSSSSGAQRRKRQKRETQNRRGVKRPRDDSVHHHAGDTSRKAQIAPRQTPPKCNREASNPRRGRLSHGAQHLPYASQRPPILRPVTVRVIGIEGRGPKRFPTLGLIRSSMTAPYPSNPKGLDRSIDFFNGAAL